MKKALTGPRKRSVKGSAQRRGIVAAARRRGESPRGRRRRALGERLLAWSRRVDRLVDRALSRAEPVALRAAAGARRAGQLWIRRLLLWARPARRAAGRLVRWAGRRLRPVGVLFLRLLGSAERRARQAAALSARAATRASALVTQERAIGGVIAGSAACLLASQFIDFRGVEVGSPGYAGLPEAARAPLVDVETPLDAHSYALVAVALLGLWLGISAIRSHRRGLGRAAVVLGLLSAVVVLLVDRPAGLDAGSQTAYFSGATAVLEPGFYAQLAAAAGLILGGVLLLVAPKAAARYHARPCRTRISWSERVASGLRRRLRRRASSRGTAARRPSPRRRGAASAPASQP